MLTVLASCTRHHASEPARPVRIMCLGDSITSGELDPDDVGGYRAQLRTRLTAAGISADLVGSFANGPMADNQHEGVSGNEIADIRARVDTALLAAAPDVVVLHAGTNDAIQGTSTIADDFAALMDDVLSHGCALVVLTPIVTFGAERDAILQELADAMPAMVAARRAQGHDVVLVDARPRWALSAYEGDGIHPGPVMYGEMGDLIFDDGIAVVLGR